MNRKDSTWDLGTYSTKLENGKDYYKQQPDEYTSEELPRI